MLQSIMDHKDAIIIAALAVSEALALIPALKSNSILTLCVNVLKSLLPKKAEPKL